MTMAPASQPKHLRFNIEPPQGRNVEEEKGQDVPDPYEKIMKRLERFKILTCPICEVKNVKYICLDRTCGGYEVATYYDECSLLLHSNHEHIHMTHDDMDQAMEVLSQSVTRPGEVKPQKPKMTVSLRQNTSTKQAASTTTIGDEEEKTTDPSKTPSIIVDSSKRDQAKQIKSPVRGQAQTQVLAGQMRIPNVEAKTNDLILNIQSEVNP